MFPESQPFPSPIATSFVMNWYARSLTLINNTARPRCLRRNKFCDRAALPGDGYHAAMDQSAENGVAKLARPSCFRNYPAAARGDKAPLGDLQQRQLSLPQARDGRIDHAVRFRAAGLECFAWP